MGLLPIPSPRFTQGASRAGIRRAAALYDKRLLPPSFTFAHRRWRKTHKQADLGWQRISWALPLAYYATVPKGRQGHSKSAMTCVGMSPDCQMKQRPRLPWSPHWCGQHSLPPNACANI